MAEEIISAYVEQKIPAPFQGRFLELVRETIRAAEERFAPIGTAAIPTYPESGKLGVVEMTPVICFNTTTFRKKYSDTTGWQIGPIAETFKASSKTYLVIGGYENPEAVPKSVELKWYIGGRERIVEDLRLLPRMSNHVIGCDPFQIGPSTDCYFEVNIEATGYDHLKPIGVVIAAYEYLKSTAFEA